MKISIIGAGNVGSNFAARFLQAGVEDVCLYSPSLGNMSAFIPQEADVVIIAVTDDAIPGLLASLPSAPSTLWIHTSGSVGIDAFEPEKYPRRGIIYPLQTMLKGVEPDWDNVPIFIEGNDELMSELARMLSPRVAPLDSLSRRRAHAAAVLCCNLAMYLWSLSERVMTEAGLDFSMLRPLMELTLERAVSGSPEQSLTGPARRGDLGTIHKHLDALDDETAEVYKLLTQNILNRFHPELKI
ncbi:MAG: DUF2520 domain-containing protein [Bacteroidales bacterium]|nr:DUF2520 domain-containing protein [Bacteroidales bacterium]